MNYPVKFIFLSSNEYKVEVPDLPGCHVISATIEDGFVEIKKAINAHLMILAEYGETIPPASSIHNHNQTSVESVTWALVEIDVTPFMGKSHKINVTLPELLIKKIDDVVSCSQEYKSRSGFIASACIKTLDKLN